MSSGYSLIVRSAVHETLPEDAHETALAAWTRISAELVGAPSLRELSRKLCTEAGHAKLENSFYAALLRNFFSQRPDHAAPGAATNAAPAAATPERPARRDPANSARPLFTVLVHGFLDQLRTVSGQDSNGTLARALTDAISDRNRRSAIERWLMRGDGMESAPCDLAQQRAIMHSLYVQACREFGPVMTDGVLTKTLQQVRTDPRALHQPPEQWL